MSARDSMGPIHVPFTWLDDSIKNDQNAQFAEMALIVAQGACTIASIAQKNATDLVAIAGDGDGQPLLSAFDIDALIGLMVISLTNLGVAAEERIDRLEFAARKGVKS